MSKAGTWYFTKEELENSPSRRDGCSQRAEKELRETTCQHLQEVGKKLKLPQLAIATAIVFFHRFFARESYKRYDRIVVATACLFLAGKVEEAPKKLNQVILTSYQILVSDQKNVPPLKDSSQKFKELREKILAMERVLLQIIAFDMFIEHPYKYIMKYRNQIPGTPESTRQLVQVAWNFVNDSLRTTLALQHDAKTTAVAALYLAFKFLKMQAPETNKAWWLQLHGTVQQDTLEDISNCILDLYDDDKEKDLHKDHKTRPLEKTESHDCKSMEICSAQGGDSAQHETGKGIAPSKPDPVGDSVKSEKDAAQLTTADDSGIGPERHAPQSNRASPY
jgi:cyclin T